MRTRERIPLHDHSDNDSGGVVASSTIVAITSGGTGTASSAPPAAADVPIADIAGNYAAANVEDALTEIADTYLTEDEVIALLTPDVYACASLTVIGGRGSIAAGAHTDLHAVGGTTVQVNESTGAVGFNVEAAFTGVDGLTNVYVHGYYTGNHADTGVQLYNYDTTGWDTVITFGTGQSSMQLYSGAIADGAPYFDGGGNAVARFYHPDNGNTSHRLYLDYLALSHATGTTGGLALDDLTDVNAPAPDDRDVLTWDDGAGEWVAATPSGGPGGGDATGQLGAVFDGGKAEPAAGTFGDLIAPYSGTITGWTILADETGSAVFDVWADTLGHFPPASGDAITGTALPALSAADHVSSTTLTGWSTTITAGQVFRFVLVSISGCKRVSLTLAYDRI